MSLKVDGDAVFGPGRAEFVAPGVERRARETRFPGLSGVRILTLGGDRREFRQTGILVAEGASAAAAEDALNELRVDLDALVQDAVHTVLDDFTHVWSNLVLMAWRPTGPRRGPILVGAVYRVTQPYEAAWVECAEEAAS